jgi:hypothetical protein
LARAAFASLQPRLFGRWARALSAAGLDADDVSLYRVWDRNTVVFEIRSRYQADEPLHSGAAQKDDPGLHSAALRHFGSWERALRAARLNPALIRQRQRWTKQRVKQALAAAQRRKVHLSDSAVRGQYPALHAAATRLFGSFAAARRSAGVAWKRGKRRAKKRTSESPG